MATRKLLATILIMSLVSFFALPMASFADPATQIHVFIDNSISVQDLQITYYMEDGTTTASAILNPQGGHYETADLGWNVTSSLKWLKFDYKIGTTPMSKTYYYPADFGVGKPIAIGQEGVGTGTVKFTLMSLPGIEPTNGTVTITKDVIGISDSTLFDFTFVKEEVENLEISTLVPADLTVGEEHDNIMVLPFGTYTFTETPKNGYNVVAGSFTITLDADNLTANVPFTNTLIPTTGTVTITKDVLGISDPTLFNFTFEPVVEDSLSTSVLKPVDLTVGETHTNTMVLPFGTYIFTEAPEDGYDVVNGSFRITLDANNLTANVPFTNSVQGLDLGTLTIQKDVTGSPEDTLFTFHIHNANALSDEPWILHASETSPQSISLPVGDYVVEEDVDSDLYTTSPTSLSTQVTLTTNGAIVLFENTLKETPKEPSISLDKKVSPDVVSSRTADVIYTFVVTNNGPVPLYNIHINDTTLNFHFDFGWDELGVGETFTTSSAFSLSNLGTSEYPNWDGDIFVNEAVVTSNLGNERTGPTDSDSATVTYSSYTPPRHRDPTPPPVVIPEPEVPAAVVPVLDEPIPAAPLPKTGGLDPGFLYGLGALLAGSGLVIKRRKDK